MQTKNITSGYTFTFTDFLFSNEQYRVFKNRICIVGFTYAVRRKMCCAMFFDCYVHFSTVKTLLCPDRLIHRERESFETCFNCEIGGLSKII